MPHSSYTCIREAYLFVWPRRTCRTAKMSHLHGVGQLRVSAEQAFVLTILSLYSTRSSRQVVVASRSRSLSQTFWAHHQAADGGAQTSTTMQGAMARLEAEIVSLRNENSR